MTGPDNALLSAENAIGQVLRECASAQMEAGEAPTREEQGELYEAYRLARDDRKCACAACKRLRQKRWDDQNDAVPAPGYDVITMPELAARIQDTLAPWAGADPDGSAP
jgi:hypothetical protein